MTTKAVELEMDAVAKLEAAKWSLDESLSAVVRRAQFPGKPHLARELLEDFQHRAGRSPLSEEALDRLAEAQRNPIRYTGPVLWTERDRGHRHARPGAA
ncbi:MAG: hypothetical protein EXS31_16945 [Pedosphaera sp.]|nr:hypothetical protein [Pedosphaera sp.]